MNINFSFIKNNKKLKIYIIPALADESSIWIHSKTSTKTLMRAVSFIPLSIGKKEVTDENLRCPRCVFIVKFHDHA